MEDQRQTRGPDGGLCERKKTKFRRKCSCGVDGERDADFAEAAERSAATMRVASIPEAFSALFDSASRRVRNSDSGFIGEHLPMRSRRAPRPLGRW